MFFHRETHLREDAKDRKVDGGGVFLSGDLRTEVLVAGALADVTFQTRERQFGAAHESGDQHFDILCCLSCSINPIEGRKRQQCKIVFSERSKPVEIERAPLSEVSKSISKLNHKRVWEHQLRIFQEAYRIESSRLKNNTYELSLYQSFGQYECAH